jgi:hypothetical protein
MSSQKGVQYTFGSNPVWEVPGFRDLMMDSFIDPVYERGSINSSVEFTVRVLLAISSQCKSWLPPFNGDQNIVHITTLLQGLAATSLVLPKSKNEEEFLEFLSDLKNKISIMTKGTFLIIPGGWINEQEEQSLLYVVEKTGDGFSFAVCNTGGSGIEYHPVTADSPLHLKYKFSLVINDIPAHRLADSSFWFMLFRMQV